MTDTQSAEIASIMEALALAHAKIDNVSQDREVEVQMKNKQTGQPAGKYKFRYATLAGILHHIRPALTENGLWFTQFVRGGEMVTRLFHKSGQWLDSGMLQMPDIKGSPQDIGSIISYFKRYSLSAAMGLAAEEDTDAEQGEREVSFRAVRRRDTAPEEQQTTIVEPAEGFGDWARTLISDIEKKTKSEDLDELRDNNKRFINSVQRFDPTIHAAIGKAFTDRRAWVAANPDF